MNFIIGSDAIVFQKDLGPSTSERAAAMTLFDPDLSGARVNISG